MQGEDTNAYIREIFRSFLHNYQQELKIIKRSNFAFESVDNLSGVYDKECKKCMERKKITLNCEFIGFKNGILNYKCKKCKKSYTKVANE